MGMIFRGLVMFPFLAGMIAESFYIDAGLMLMLRLNRLNNNTNLYVEEHYQGRNIWLKASRSIACSHDT